MFRTSGRRLMGYSLGIFLMLGGIPFAKEFAQEARKAALTRQEVLSLATSNKLGLVSSSQVVELIRTRGLDFFVTDDLLLTLESLPTDPAILDALRKLKSPEPAPSSTTSPYPPSGSATSGSNAGVNNHNPLIPDERSWPDFLEKVRDKALDYSDELPNFICTQVTTRYEREFPGSWRQVDNFVAELTYFDQKENYKLISVADRPATGTSIESLRGSWSSGEFGTTLLALFHPQTNAKFNLEETEPINGHTTVRISYQVPKETSTNSITYNKQRKIIAPYRGRCWIDPESFKVVRLEEKSFDIPADFPITRAERLIDYELQTIAGQKYWLPSQAEMVMVEGAINHYVRNVIQFKKYRKYEAEVKIVPE
ncbi:MAG: hypothetical protein U0V70_05170 [Terriglobia bacterium]